MWHPFNNAFNIGIAISIKLPLHWMDKYIIRGIVEDSFTRNKKNQNIFLLFINLRLSAFLFATSSNVDWIN